MNARRSPTGAKPGAESAEVRKARNGGGSRAVGECGRSAEEVRKLSVPLSSVPSAHPEAGPAAAPPLALARTRAKKPREGLPAQPPAARGDGWPEVTSMAERGLMEPRPAASSRASDRARAVV